MPHARVMPQMKVLIPSQYGLTGSYGFTSFRSVLINIHNFCGQSFVTSRPLDLNQVLVRPRIVFVIFVNETPPLNDSVYW